MNPWDVLGIEASRDLKIIKRAYSTQLKQHKPDTDPEGYQRLREAFDFARQWARSEYLMESSEEDSFGVMDVALVPLPRSEGLSLVNASSPDAGFEQEKLPNVRIDNENLPPPQTGSSDEVLLNRLLTEIHEALVQQSQAAAFEQFLLCLKQDALVSIDVAGMFEMRMLNYLYYWIEQDQNEDSHTFPLGFMRQVVAHYGWDQHFHSSPLAQETLDAVCDFVLPDSGINVLRRLAGKGGWSDDFSRWMAANILLGKFSPVVSESMCMWQSIRCQIFALLDHIEQRNDGSFEFELNTANVSNWLKRRDSVFLSWWMVWVGILLGIFAFPLSSSLISAGVIIAVKAPMMTLIALYVLITVLCVGSIYGLIWVWKMYLGRLLKRLDKLLPVTLEPFTGLTCAGLVFIIEYLSAIEPQARAFLYFCLFLVLPVFYGMRVFIPVVGGLLVGIGYVTGHENGALSDLDLNQVGYPAIVGYSIIYLAFQLINYPAPIQGESSAENIRLPLWHVELGESGVWILVLTYLFYCLGYGMGWL